MNREAWKENKDFGKGNMDKLKSLQSGGQEKNFDNIKKEDSSKYPLLSDEDVREFILNGARELAKNKIQGDKFPVASSQVRKFYDAALRIRRKIKASNNFNDLYQIYNICQRPRDRNVVNDDFKNFIKQVLSVEDDRKKLDNFILKFEALVCYCKKRR